MIKLAVIGHPIEHSLSPGIHQTFAKQCGLIIDYQKIDAPLDKFNETVDILRTEGFTGANVTTPFKINAFHYADTLTNRARQAGSVNTLIFKGNQCIGDNTDGTGLIRDLNNKNIILKNKHILLIGAGGAAHGTLPSIITEQPKQVFILNRTQEKAITLAQQFNCAIYNNAKKIDLIINASHADFKDHLLFPACDLSETICHDLNYSTRHIPFKTWCELNHAIQCFNGFGMLVEQAAESFYLWTNQRPTLPIKIN